MATDDRLGRHLDGCRAMAAGTLLAGLVFAPPAANAIIYYSTGLSLEDDALFTSVVDLDFSPAMTAAIVTEPTAFPTGIYEAAINDVYGINYTALNGTGVYYMYFATSTYGPPHEVSKLTSGTTIDGTLTWYGYGSGAFYGKMSAWAVGDTGYVGIKIVKAGLSYYGWISVYNDPTTYAEVTGFAWESIAGTSIIAGTVPEPNGLLLAGLALGAAGLGAWRRRRREEAVA